MPSAAPTCACWLQGCLFLSPQPHRDWLRLLCMPLDLLHVQPHLFYLPDRIQVYWTNTITTQGKKEETEAWIVANYLTKEGDPIKTLKSKYLKSSIFFSTKDIRKLHRNNPWFWVMSWTCLALMCLLKMVFWEGTGPCVWTWTCNADMAFDF